MRIAEIIVDEAHADIDRVFDYYIQADCENISAGSRVLVPFGRRKIEGYVIKLKDTTDVPKNKMKSILKVLDEYPVFTEKQLELAQWMKQQYSCLLIYALRVMLPSPVRGGSASAKQQKYAEINFDLKIADEIIETLKNSKKQKQIIEYLLEKGEDIPLSQINSDLGESSGSIKLLREKKLINITEKRIYRKPMGTMEDKQDKRFVHTSAQKAAIEKILNNKTGNKKFIIHGITGSGKTEVYMHLCSKMLSEGKGVIILVPEISLTPQMVSSFRARFKEEGAVLHSRLSAGERLDEWQRIHSGEARIVIGARSAVFAPVASIGLIVVDEEHETSYKSETQPRYDAVEVAQYRCAQHDAVLLLGSATPTVSRYYQAINGEYNLLSLPERVGDAELPETRIVDMREEFKAKNMSIISRKLKAELEACIDKGEKAILFLNRRGYSTHVSCRDCGYVVKCEHCDVTMTYHMTDSRLRCHYCGMEIKPPSICPECGSKYIKYFGGGTQKVAEEAQKLFPKAEVIRMDADTTNKKTSHYDILSEFEKEGAKILVGTQMITKGLDFHDVTLVGVIAADMSLYASDYRATERTFQLVSQVAGRAGRGSRKGSVVIQTYDPDNFSIIHASNHDYEAFYAEEIKMRQIMLYPPFAYYSRWVFLSEDEEGAKYEAENAFKKMREYLEANPDAAASVISMDIAPTLYVKIKGKYRYQLLIKYYTNENGQKAMSFFSSLNRYSVSLAFMTLEIDPLNMI
ncbi:MAG: primosomal protein N' [Clostridia bacterium]|nr:primosomal protein N' [Clostridia bacterium]